MSGVESILEGFVNFKRELSLVAVRGLMVVSNIIL